MSSIAYFIQHKYPKCQQSENKWDLGLSFNFYIEAATCLLVDEASLCAILFLFCPIDGSHIHSGIIFKVKIFGAQLGATTESKTEKEKNQHLTQHVWSYKESTRDDI